MSGATVRRLAEQAHTTGLVSLDERRALCRFWHDTLAARYWEVFALERERWARTARAKLEGRP